MKKQIITLLVAFFAIHSALRADTSYLLIQGPFGIDGATETFKWAVNYQSGTLITGQDLLNDVFGTPTLTGTYEDTYNLYTAGNATQGISYIDFGTDPSQLEEPFVVSITLNSTVVEQDPSFSPGWNYYVAGGGGFESYPSDGSWTYSDDGTNTRTLSDGSFDGWVFGATFPADPVVGADNAPTVANFIAVPEPSTGMLLLASTGFVVLWRRRSPR